MYMYLHAHRAIISGSLFTTKVIVLLSKCKTIATGITVEEVLSSTYPVEREREKEGERERERERGRGREGEREKEREGGREERDFVSVYVDSVYLSVPVCWLYVVSILVRIDYAVKHTRYHTAMYPRSWRF